MGWRIAERLDLVFLDRDGNPVDLFDECEIAVRAVTIREYTTVSDLIGDRLDATTENQDRIAEVAALIVDTVEEWNLENGDGTPTPRTAEGLIDGHPKSVVFGVVNAWMDAQRVGPRPFARPSNDGAPPAEIPQMPLAI